MKRRDEVTVGILITVAVIVLLLGTLWLVRGGLRSGYPLYTRFAWGQNLKQGQPVLLAGVNVGYVGDVTLRRDGYLDVMLQINDQYSIPKGSKAAVKPVGIFGDVAIALTPPMPLTSASYASGDTVPPGPPAADFNQILTRDGLDRPDDLAALALAADGADRSRHAQGHAQGHRVRHGALSPAAERRRSSRTGTSRRRWNRFGARPATSTASWARRPARSTRRRSPRRWRT